jgi:hypothetical protein
VNDEGNNLKAGGIILTAFSVAENQPETLKICGIFCLRG